MRRILSILIVFTLVFLSVPLGAKAASTTFNISGPSTLSTGETGTYTVEVTVNDAAGAQATLNYDSSFFQLVSGNTTGVWDVAANTSETVTLITVTLKCIGPIGASGSLSLSGLKAGRLTDTIPESVPCSGAPKTVTNAEATATPTAAPTTAPTTAPTATPTAAPTATPAAAPTVEPTAEPTAAPMAATTPAPTASVKPEEALVDEDIPLLTNAEQTNEAEGISTVLLIIIIVGTAGIIAGAIFFCIKAGYFKAKQAD